MASTIHDIARRAGLNASTVSRALRGDSRVKAETVRRIREIAAELHYVPNQVARSLIAGRTGTIWLVVGSMEWVLVRQIADYLSQALLKRGYELLIAMTGDRPERFESVVARLGQKVADGAVMIAPSGSLQPYGGEIEALPVPVVYLDRWAEEARLAVTNDNRRAVLGLLEVMKGAGAKSCYGGFGGRNRVSRERQEGAKEGAKRYGMVFFEDPGEYAAYLATRPGGELGGLCADNESTALAELKGYGVESKRLVCGTFDEINPATAMEYAAWYVSEQDFGMMAERAVEMLCGAMRGRSGAVTIERIAPKGMRSWR